MTPTHSQMRRETEKIPHAVHRLLTGCADDIATALPRVRQARAVRTIRTDHWLCDPISLILSFYTRGDPNAPRHLNKVAETV